MRVDEDQRLLETFRERLIEDEIVDEDRHIQDYNLDNIPEFKDKGYGSNRDKDEGVHINLCGEIGTAVSIGVYPVDALLKFNDIPGGKNILMDETVGTSHKNLIALFAKYGWEGQSVGHTNDPYQWSDEYTLKPKFFQVEDHLKSGRSIEALVNLNTFSNYIEPLDKHDAPHWAPILQVMTTHDGQEVVRLYNPYQDREEWYPFDHLVQSWTPSANYVAVVAAPPEELRWLPSP